MLSDISFTITEDDVAVGRLDKVILKRFPTSTRAFINRAFLSNSVSADGVVCKKGVVPTCGSVITIPQLLEKSDLRVVPQRGKLDIIYFDDSVIAVNKPPGQPCHPIAPLESGTLANALLYKFPELEHVGDDPLMSGLLHRIDSGTSGLVLCARNPDVYKAARKQFSQNTVEKKYTALVHGRVSQPGGVSGYLAHSSSYRGRMRCVSGSRLAARERAMFAETFYKPLSESDNTTLLEVTIFTGVTHQIRCQLASIGHPIVGDTTYGSAEQLKTSFGSYHLLHASAIKLTHPVSADTLTISNEADFTR
jgi:23S rRNA pseudouridine1911/1915/1917 synthase